MVIALMFWLLGAAQQPLAAQNARIELQQDSSITSAITRASAAGEPVWIAWRAPMVPGDRNLCSTWSDGETVARGLLLEEQPQRSGLREFPPSGDALRLEAGTSLVVLARIVDGTVERLRVTSDDCTVDGGGRRLFWLPAVTPADSVSFLAALDAAPGTNEPARRVDSTRVMAIALHADVRADEALDRLLTSEGALSERQVAQRNLAAMWTGRTRARRGYQRLTALLGSETDAGYRRVLTDALAETREPETLASLLAIARSDTNEQVRAAAMFAAAHLTPATRLDDVRVALAAEKSDVVKRRAVRGLARRSTATSVPLLIELARTSPDPVVRAEAVRALGQARTPESIAFLTSVLTR